MDMISLDFGFGTKLASLAKTDLNVEIICLVLRGSRFTTRAFNFAFSFLRLWSRPQAADDRGQVARSNWTLIRRSWCPEKPVPASGHCQGARWLRGIVGYGLGVDTLERGSPLLWPVTRVRHAQTAGRPSWIRQFSEIFFASCLWTFVDFQGLVMIEANLSH